MTCSSFSAGRLLGVAVTIIAVSGAAQASGPFWSWIRRQTGNASGTNAVEYYPGTELDYQQVQSQLSVDNLLPGGHGGGGTRSGNMSFSGSAVTGVDGPPSILSKSRIWTDYGISDTVTISDPALNGSQGLLEYRVSGSYHVMLDSSGINPGSSEMHLQYNTPQPANQWHDLYWDLTASGVRKEKFDSFDLTITRPFTFGSAFNLWFAFSGFQEATDSVFPGSSSAFYSLDATWHGFTHVYQGGSSSGQSVSNYQLQTQSGHDWKNAEMGAVPEPGSLAFLTFGSLALLRRRSRRAPATRKACTHSSS